ncbi:hypothetical protein [Ornithinibacillus sp. 179-J 7C1 HS]|uniref:hypothetical protein n=1 Tax=Ornithinibacillus sp. 179-J 7C1 HS TaxID=3142384 RepID=UPI0039A2115F
MRINKTIISITSALLLGVVGGTGYSLIFNETQPQASIEADQLMVVSDGIVSEGEALNGVQFAKKMYTIDNDNLPFKVGAVSEEVSNVMDYEQVFHRYYEDASKEFVLELQVSNSNVIPMDEPESKLFFKEVDLSDGIKGKYADNGSVEMLYWQQEGLSYNIAIHSVGNDDKVSLNSEETRVIFGVEKMINISKNMKK